LLRSALLGCQAFPRGVDVDRLAYPLHCPIVCDHQTKGQSFLSGVALSHHAAVGGGPFLGGAKPPGLDIGCIVDRLGTCVTESYMEKLTFTRVSYIRDIMAIMRVPLVESLCQTVMGWIPALNCMLSGTREFLWPCLVTSGNKCRRFPRPQC
jgi:hypothetical protein